MADNTDVTSIAAAAGTVRPAPPALETLRIELIGPGGGDGKAGAGAVPSDTAVATLCRPERLNAVAEQTLLDLVALADWLREREDLRFLILDHEGPVFAAGAHLGELKGMLDEPATARHRLRANQRIAHEMMRKLAGMEQISFAALRGSAYGAGVAIAMAADFRVLAEDAVLNLPETKLGMFLTYGVTPLVVRAVGPAAAKKMIYFAEDWSAEESLAAGAVDWVEPADRVRARIEERIDVLRAYPFGALRLAKQTVDASAPAAFGDMIHTEPELVAGALTEGDVAEQLEAFLHRKRG